MKTQLIPEQTDGKKTDLEHSVSFGTEEVAADCYRRACKRLLNPRVWHDLSGTFSSRFTLTGAHGDEVSRLAQEHDHIKIDIPGIGNATGEGYDWVRVERIMQEGDHAMGMLLRASDNPHGQVKDTAHFFTETATSSFILTLEGKTVTVSYHGRNESVNDETHSVKDNIRNSIIAAGARAGFSEMQWMSLLKGLLEAEIGG